MGSGTFSSFFFIFTEIIIYCIHEKRKDMPRALRIKEPGIYHVVNRGVERRVVFYQEEDFDKFLSLLDFVSKTYSITVHAFCLMNNHYHVLIETNKENISDAIKYLNSNYAAYFNKKHKRSGHLWQSRFFSSLLFDDEHFWIVAKYIERNPVKANVVKQLEDYRYQSLFQYLYNQKHISLLKKSKIKEMSSKEYYDFLNSELNEEYFEKVYTSPKKVKNKLGQEILMTKRLEKFFEQDRDINRTQNANDAFTYGYSKAEIARFLGLTSSTVSKLLK